MFNPLGSLSTSSSPVIKVSSNVEISTPVVQNDVDTLASKDYVNETFSHRTTYNPVTSWTAISSLYGYANSTPIVVTYYTINNNSANLKTADSEFALNIGLTKNFVKIRNFELRLEGELNYTYDTNTNISACTGAAFIYPRFDVSIGDVFLYQLGTGVLGLFKVNDKLRLSIDKDSAHKIEFELIRFPKQIELEELDKFVDQTAYFFKDVFLNGNVGLVFDDTYQLLQLIHKHKDKMSFFYFDKFYNHQHQTLFRADGIYDPYVIEFLSKFVNFHALEKYPLQLLSKIENYNKSIWAYLQKPDRYTKGRLFNNLELLIKQYSHRDTDLNSLINETYTKVTNDVLILDKYLLDNFINNRIEVYTSIDLVLQNYTDNKKINPEDLFACMAGYEDMSDNDQFYFIPIYLYLLAVLEGILFR